MMSQSITETIETLASRARTAALELAQLSSQQKNAFLQHLAKALPQSSEKVLQANLIDLEQAKAVGLSGPMLERLKIDEAGIQAMVEGILQVATLPTRLGKNLNMSPARGFDLRKIRVPIGLLELFMNHGRMSPLTVLYSA